MGGLRLLVCVMLAATVAACGELPQPFAHGEAGATATYPLARLILDVRVDPVEGLPEGAGRALSRAVAEALGGYGVTASPYADTKSHFILKGKAAAVPPAPNYPVNLLIVWVLHDADGSETGLHVQELDTDESDWQPLDRIRVRTFAAEPAKAIAALVRVDAELPTAAGPPPGQEALFVAGVDGAPGDGNASLATAIRQELRLAGLTVAPDLESASAVLRGIVELTPPVAGDQTVSIVWRVEDRDGKTLGEAAQKNAVAAGSLNGRWGAVAGYAAAAAVIGIRDILDSRQPPATAPTSPNADSTP